MRYLKCLIIILTLESINNVNFYFKYLNLPDKPLQEIKLQELKLII